MTTSAYDLARQARFETLGFSRAIKRYHEDSAHKDWSELSAGQALLREIVPPLSALITTHQSSIQLAMGHAGRQPEWAWQFLLLSADKLAVITLMTALRGAVGTFGDRDATQGDGAPVTACAKAVATAIRVQVEYDKWAKQSPDLEKTLRFKHPKVDRRVWSKWRVKVEAAREEPWSSSLEAGLGAHLLGLLCEAAPKRFSSATRRISGGRTQLFVTPSQETLDLIDDVTARAEVARPMLMPMTIPPIPYRYSPRRPNDTDPV